MMALPTALLKNLNVHVDDPSKIFEIICDKCDRKDKNNLSNLCKKLKNITLNNNKVDSDSWVTYLSRLNDCIDNISIGLRRQKKVDNESHE